MKEKIIAALKRAAHTAAQTALGMLVVGAGVEEVDWLHIVSVAAVAAVISLLKSIVIGMPETDDDGDYITDMTEDDDEPLDL